MLSESLANVPVCLDHGIITVTRLGVPALGV
jgi:hypothetical protein